MWKYVGDYNIYRCPDGDKWAYVAYSMSMSMNTYPNAGGTVSQPCPQFTNINQIVRPNERFVFLDTGIFKRGAFYVVYSGSGSSSPGRWYDMPPMRHSQGTTFSFADGHTEYRKWTDPHTFAAVSGTWGGGTIDYCDCDLRWMEKITWGSVPYTCTNPAKHCEY
jgi:prepilin-type processing-associated H-X9-DG protein